MAGIADTSKDGLISFSEFQAFEGLLCAPDALYRTAFQLFDRKGNGSISYGKLTIWKHPLFSILIIFLANFQRTSLMLYKKRNYTQRYLLV